MRGHLDWIGLSPGLRAPIREVEEAEVRIGTGLVGDRHAAKGRGRRQVTLVQAEALRGVEEWLGREVRPVDVRRNLVVSGIDLQTLDGRRFRVGTVILEGTGPCDPCDRMDETLGPGGRAALEGRGGLCATVIEPGTVRIGDPVEGVRK